MNDLYVDYPINKFSRHELSSYFDLILISSGFFISKKDFQASSVCVYEIEKNDKKYYLNVKLKNITECGWKDRKFIRRIQTPPTRDFFKTEANKAYLLGGITMYNNSPVFVCWNSNNYIYHKTNRSCYVYVDSFKKAYDNGFYYGQDCEQEVYCCNKNGFETLLHEYINDNVIL